MGVLSHKMQEQQPLGFTEKLPVPAALEDVFNKLVKALAPLQHPASQIIFSVDSFDESLAELGVYQNDKFIKKIEKYRGTPNIKICHMRHYSYAFGQIHLAQKLKFSKLSSLKRGAGNEIKRRLLGTSIYWL